MQRGKKNAGRSRNVMDAMELFRNAVSQVHQMDRSFGRKYFTLHLFAPWNPVRIFCIQVVEHPAAKAFFMTSAVLSCVVTAVGCPRAPPTSSLRAAT